MRSGRPEWAGPPKKVLPRRSQRALARITQRGWSGALTFLTVLLLLILLVVAYLIGRQDCELRLKNRVRTQEALGPRHESDQVAIVRVVSRQSSVVSPVVSPRFGMPCALSRLMGVKRVEELLVWQRAKQFVDAISALVKRPSFRCDITLRNQLDSSSTSILFNITEGFGQPTDRAFARYLYISRTSSNEARVQLLVARDRGHITAEELERCSALSEEINRMATGLIGYLRREDRKFRP